MQKIHSIITTTTTTTTTIVFNYKMFIELKKNLIVKSKYNREREVFCV